MPIEFPTEDEEVIDRWFLTRNLSEGTQENYKIALRDFTEVIGKSPKELYEEADAEEEKGKRPIKTKAYHYMLKFKKHLINNNSAPNTAKYKFSAIKSFYKALGITLPEIKMDSGDIGLEENQGKPLKREDIQRLANSANPRERAIIYLMALSGMGQQEARDLTIRKYLESASSAIGKDLDDVYDIFKFENEILKEILTLYITRKKVKYRYITFIPPEASREIISYLKERCYGRNEKIRIQNSNEPIFANKLGGPLSSDSIITNFRLAGKKAGFKRDENVYSFWRSHAMRKYFISTIINKKGEKIIADFMAGHKIGKQDRAYWQANPDDLKAYYMEALPFLSIDGAKVKDYSSEEARRFENDMKKKDEEIKMLQEKVDVLQGDMDQKLGVFGEIFKSLKEQDSSKHFNMKLFPKLPGEDEED